MKLLLRQPDRLVFALSSREKTLLENLMVFFPMRPDNPPILSREPDARLTEATDLLQSNLREQRAELAGWIRTHLSPEGALRPHGEAWILTLSGADTERLLQVLNDLRVGAWHKLGCPEDIDGSRLATSPSQAPLFMIMTLAGQFEMVLLAAGHADAVDPEDRPPEPA
ncbi:MAG: hypothetical protein KF833_23010 [Verrucomicrobiae bacterium]|nr:hypothetical protein [Verrucomicrobiae bacterium]